MSFRVSSKGMREKSFKQLDQINWWLDADPVEVQAFGRLAFYGRNGSYRAKNCRECPFKDQCRRDVKHDRDRCKKINSIWVQDKDQGSY